MDLDPQSLDRVHGSTPPFAPVRDSDLWREWQDSVRGRVGTVVRVRWHSVRSATQVDLKSLYALGVSPAEAAEVVVREWAVILEPVFEAPLC
jgi:hypothetical protein